MATSSRREREIARAHYERQQARRQHKVDRRRRRRKIIAIGMVILVVIGTGTAITLLLNDDEQTIEPSAQPSPSTSAKPAGCTYTKDPSGTAAKDVGIPTYDAQAGTAPFSATLTTNRGPITFDADTDAAPCTTNSFKYLAGKKYFDGTKCHRLTTQGIFVLQCGDPTATGSGGPGYGFGIENAPKDGVFPAGTVAMARSSDPNSNGSQFFIVYKDTKLPTEGGGYTIFGKVTDGLDVVQTVAKAGTDDANSPGDGHPKQPVTLEKVTTTPA